MFTFNSSDILIVYNKLLLLDLLQCCTVETMTDAFSISLCAYDRGNSRNLYVKADGKRFDDNQTIKISTDVKYDLTVQIKPNNPELKLEYVPRSHTIGQLGECYFIIVLPWERNIYR